MVRLIARCAKTCCLAGAVVIAMVGRANGINLQTNMDAAMAGAELDFMFLMWLSIMERMIFGDSVQRPSRIRLGPNRVLVRHVRSSHRTRTRSQNSKSRS